MDDDAGEDALHEQRADSLRERREPSVSLRVTPEMRKRYFRTHPVIVCIALFALIGGLTMQFGGRALHESVIGSVLPGTIPDHVWAAFYMFAGIFVLRGLWSMDARWEMLGLLWMSVAYGTLVYARLSQQDSSFTAFLTAWFGVTGATGICIGCFIRVLLLRFRGPEPGRARQSDYSGQVSE